MLPCRSFFLGGEGMEILWVWIAIDVCVAASWGGGGGKLSFPNNPTFFESKDPTSVTNSQEDSVEL